jgi:hypothetical protein
MYARLLREQGKYVISVEGIDWYDYNGFMMPAYLPHCCPTIRPEVAQEVLRTSSRPFVRWDSMFGQVKKSPWWYVIRKGKWSLQQSSRNTRSKIRRGCKRLMARAISPEEVLKFGYEICRKAEERYEKKGFAPSPEAHEQRVKAASKVSPALEFFGVFAGEDLVGYSENYIQNNAVFWESIWYDPEFLGKYASYVLINEMLDYYLNHRKFAFVSDGCRSIYHKTNVQDFLIDVFGFTKEYALLNVTYSAAFAVGVKLGYPLRNLVWALSNRWSNTTLDRGASVLRQECIRRACWQQARCLPTTVR